MAVRIVRLGTARHPKEGLRIGTVRRPPRGVPRREFSTGNWYDVWFPVLAPSVETMKLGQAAETPTQWTAFTKQYRAEMAAPAASQTLDVLAALSKTSDFSVGCYCEEEAHCHRSVLRTLLAERGATIQVETVTESYAPAAQGLAALGGSEPRLRAVRRRRAQ